MALRIENVSKTFGQFYAVRDVTLHVEHGELVTFLGPSGCGKTTLLRVIAGLETPDAGRVLFDGEDATFQKVQIRRVGFVFQHYALFRHMTVFENIAFGLRVRPKKQRPSEEAIRERVSTLLQLVHLEWLANYYPSQLSGGQRQRIALARALAVEPKVLLLDEPFGALDAQVRKDLRRWLRRLHDELNVTSILVTHDQEEALEVSDRVVIMREGAIEQIGSPEDVYDNPGNSFVYEFLGNVNLFRGRITQGKAQIGPVSIDLPDTRAQEGEKAVVYVRPHAFDIDHQPLGEKSFKTSVWHISPAGPRVKIDLMTEQGDLIQAEIPREEYRRLDLKKNLTVFASPRESKVFLDNENKGAKAS